MIAIFSKLIFGSTQKHPTPEFPEFCTVLSQLIPKHHEDPFVCCLVESLKDLFL